MEAIDSATEDVEVPVNLRVGLELHAGNTIAASAACNVYSPSSGKRLNFAFGRLDDVKGETKQINDQ